jgi:hypothetical protein
VNVFTTAVADPAVTSHTVNVWSPTAQPPWFHELTLPVSVPLPESVYGELGSAVPDGPVAFTE